MHKDGTYRWMLNRGLRSATWIIRRTAWQIADGHYVPQDGGRAISTMPSTTPLMDCRTAPFSWIAPARSATSQRRADDPMRCFLFLDMDRFKLSMTASATSSGTSFSL